MSNLNNWQAASGPATSAFAITPSDSADLPEIARLYVGTSGNVQVTLSGMPDGTSVTLPGVPAGFAPLLVKRVWAAGTTAGNLIGLA